VRGKRAKKLRRKIYQDRVTSAKGRSYYRLDSGQIVCGQPRITYQHAKRAWKRRER
jgi:hypothetical protein